jgi:tryptophan-rich sensory protein
VLPLLLRVPTKLKGSPRENQKALVTIVALLLAICMTIMSTSRVDRVAAYLLIPYLAWVAYATTINAGVVPLN